MTSRFTGIHALRDYETPTNLQPGNAASEPVTKTPNVTSSSTGAMKSSTENSNFTLAIVTTLPCEFDAVEDKLDDGKSEFFNGSDAFKYKYGKIWGQDCLVVKLTKAGPVDASQNVEHLVTTFPSLKLILLVGVCAGVAQPPNRNEIFIGDVIVGNSLIAYAESIRWIPDGVARRAASVQSSHYRKVSQTLGFFDTRSTIRDFQNDLNRLPEVKAMNRELDTLFPADYHHVHRDHCEAGECDITTGRVCHDALHAKCDAIKCDKSKLITRTPPKSITVHVGTYASAPIVMRNPVVRDRLADETGAIAFEMETTGLWDVEKPVVPIKGVCDYADSHKNKDAQETAAVTAACVMRRFVKMYLGQGEAP